MLSLLIPTPPDFRFRATVESHGWIQLAPYHYEAESAMLARPLRLSDETVLQLRMMAGKDERIHVEISGREVLDSRFLHEIEEAVTLCFNLRQDLSEFYAGMAKHEAYAWVTEQKAARIFASPTVWEDLAKTLLTTNTTWGNTKAMSKKLVALDPDDCFPIPQQLMLLDFEDFAARVGMGYRAAYLYELAQAITAGDLDVEAWRNFDSASLYKAVRGLKGFGDYAAGTMLRLLGHHDRLAIDSVARAAYLRVTGEKAANDKAIEEHYASFGEWRGLVQWMDCIRES